MKERNVGLNQTLLEHKNNIRNIGLWFCQENVIEITWQDEHPQFSS